MVSLTNQTCPAENTASVEQATFWDGHWDAHEIGWVIAGATAAVTTIITLTTVYLHARNYYKPKEQRQILRILLMPAIYAVVSFFSYRYFRSYTYYSVAVVAYESLVLVAFLMLLLQYIGESNEEQRKIFKDKEKRNMPLCCGCIRFRPSKPYFLHAIKWAVLQYAVLRPLISIVEIICQAYGVLCPTQYSVYYAEVYLDAADFVFITVALYGLMVFYALVKERLAGKRPLAKFLSIKIVVILLFYQSFVFSILQSYGVIKATEYWTATNVADGLAALCVCCEMVIMSGVYAWAYSYIEYKHARPVGAGHTSVFWAILDSLNYTDLVCEGWRGLKFLWDFIRNKPGTHAGKRSRKRLAEKGLLDESSQKPIPEYGLDINAAFHGIESDESPPAFAEGDDSISDSYSGDRYPVSSHGAAERGQSMVRDSRGDPRVTTGDAGGHQAAAQYEEVDHPRYGMNYPPLRNS